MSGPGTTCTRSSAIPYQPVFEGYTTLAAWAKVTSRARLGLFVGANTFRNPGLVAKALTTLDYLSGGRVIGGLGAAWHELEHEALRHRVRRRALVSASTGSRNPSRPSARLLAGETVTSPPGGRYDFRDLRLLPPPVQQTDADHDRRLRREEDAPDRRDLRRHVEHGRTAREARPQARRAAGALRRRSGATRRRSSSRSGASRSSAIRAPRRAASGRTSWPTTGRLGRGRRGRGDGHRDA